MTGNELLLNLVQIGLTVSAVALALFVLRKVLKKRYPARAICFVWAILAIRLLIPVQLTLPDPPVQVTPRTTYLTRTNFTTEQLARAGLPVIEQDGGTTTRRWVTAAQAQALTPNDMPSLISFDLGYALACIWGLGMAAFAGWQVFTYWKFAYLLRHSAAPAERDTLRRVFEEQKQSLGIRRDIPLVVTPAADCPMLAGFLKPALYLPDEAFSEQEAMFIFRHELTHYKRGDLWLKLLLTAAKAVHWFNPLVYLMARFAQEDIELACDDAVVRGMDGAQRRAYGETILKSAAAQVKKRALVSCFTGDKKTLMRRFEGLFDTRAKKRGVALIVAVAVLVGSLGCAVSVGESKDSGETFEAQALAAANTWGQTFVATNGQDWSGAELMEQENRINRQFDVWDYDRFALQYEPETETCIIVYEMYFNQARAVETGYDAERVIDYPYREAQRLHFAEENGAPVVQQVEWLYQVDSADSIDSLDDFRLLYENDLGLPDFLAIAAANPNIDISTPEQAAINLLHLDAIGYMGGSSPDRIDEARDMWDFTFSFADGSEVRITLVNQFDQGWLPQGFTYENGQNSRTAADLAQQYARGVQHKSGQFVYPILSEELRADFITQQQGISGDGNWYWRYGGSSPSFRDFVIVPTEDENTYTAVFQMYGGGATDYRSAVNITVGAENGCRVITAINRCDEHLSFMLDQMSGQDDGYTMSELFNLYYDSGLAWPVIPDGVTSFNGVQLDGLTTPLDAAEAVFGYLGDYVEQTEGNVHNIVLERRFTAELVSQASAEAVVRLNFTDGSPSVDVRMEQTNGYWLPVGIAGQFDEGFTATAGEVSLPVGATVQEAVQNADGNIPLLNVGDTIELLFDPAPQGEVTIADSVIHEDGTLQYSAQETQTGTFTYTGIVASMSYSYPVERLPAELLASTLTPYIYRGVTVSYTSADGTAYSNAFVFRLAGSDIQTDYTITSTTYHNDTYGYTLTLPECFVGQGYLQEMEETVKFGMKNASPGEFSDPYMGGTVMTLCIEATAVLKENFGEDWVSGHPVPCVELAEHNGLTYYLALASDVQYDPADEAITAAYRELYQAAQAMDGSAISFDGQTDAQRDFERETLLYDLANAYAHSQNGSGNGPYTDQILVEPDISDNSVQLTIRFTTLRGDYYFTTVERVWYDRTDTITPSRTETLLNTSDGVRSLEQFILAFPLEQELPYFGETGLESLSEMASRPASLDNPDLSTPQACAAYALHLVAGEWTGADDTQSDDTTWCTYQWDDGFVQLTLQRVQLTDDSPVLWLPIGWRTEESGIGFVGQWPHYYSALAHMPNYYGARSTDDLLFYLDMGWADGAYAEAVWDEIDRRWRSNPEEVENTIDNYSGWRDSTAMREMWQRHRDSLEARFSETEIEAAYQTVLDYAAANGFSVENLRYDAATDRSWSEGIMENGVLRDNVQQDGLTIDDVITVMGDAQFGEDAWRERADGWSFTLYRGADGRWVLEDGAFGY